MTNKKQAKKIWCYPALALMKQYPPNTSASVLADVFGVTRGCIVRWRNGRNGDGAAFNVWQADKYAIKIGMHPSEIWTNWYDEE